MKRVLANILLLVALCCLTIPAIAENEIGSGAADESVSLTVENCEELAAVLSLKDPFDEKVKNFAATYAGQVIEFDGNIAYLSNHGSYKTRYDILIYAGDYSETSCVGPCFQFSDVGIFDLGLSESWSSDSVSAGMNVRITAKVVQYKEMSGLFILDPISMEERDSTDK